MAAQNRFLALNIGASQITLAEFKTRAGESPELVQYGSAALGLDPESDTNASAFIIAALKDIMNEKGIKPAPLMMCVSGQNVFPRFVKLPAVTKDKLQPMIQLEAEQNVPFPISEVVWDHQLIGDNSDGEQNAMIVAIKTDQVIGLTDCVQSAGLEPEVVDVAPLAIANSVALNYSSLEGCTMILDIGARSTNLIFLEEGRVFYRSIPVAGNSITAEIAKVFQCDFKEAERLKREKGYVALGGNFASEDDTAERISKVVRNVITRLHAEINRSISFYRSQQAGTMPVRVLLTGGSSILPHMDTFFREKLKIDVDFLNPFQFVEIGSKVNADKVGEDFYCLCEVIGLAMRKVGTCPVEINLMPPNILQKKTMRRQIPFVAAAAVMLIGAAVCFNLSASAKFSAAEQQLADAQEKLDSLNATKGKISKETKACDALEEDLLVYRDLIEERTVVARRIDALRGSLLDGMWLTSVKSISSADGVIRKLSVVVRGFDDKISAAEERAFKSGGSRKTAAEILAENIKSKPLFASEDSKNDKAVAIKKDGSVEGLQGKVREFILEIALSDAGCMKKVDQLGKAGK